MYGFSIDSGHVEGLSRKRLPSDCDQGLVGSFKSVFMWCRRSVLGLGCGLVISESWESKKPRDPHNPIRIQEHWQLTNHRRPGETFPACCQPASLQMQTTGAGRDLQSYVRLVSGIQSCQSGQTCWPDNTYRVVMTASAQCRAEWSARQTGRWDLLISYKINICGILSCWRYFWTEGYSPQ